MLSLFIRRTAKGSCLAGPMFGPKDQEGATLQYQTGFPTLKAHKDAQCYSDHARPGAHLSTFSGQPQAHGNPDPGPRVDGPTGCRADRSRQPNSSTTRYTDLPRGGVVHGHSPGAVKSFAHKNTISVENGASRASNGVLV